MPFRAVGWVPGASNHHCTHDHPQPPGHAVAAQRSKNRSKKLLERIRRTLPRRKTTPLLTMKHLLHESEQGSETLQAQPQFWKGSSVEQLPSEDYSSERRCLLLSI